MAYYNYDRVMSYDALFNFILSGRGNGKSYGAKEKAIKNFLKKGEQFIYVRRYKTELKKKHLFFDDIKDKFPNNKFEVKGNSAYIDGKLAGHFIALSTSQIEKSNAYPNVTLIIFDEFVVDKGHIRYLENEVEVFMDLYETVARLRELNGKKPVKALFLANKVSIVNPYFIYFNCIPKNDERFTVAKNGNIVIEMFTDKEFIEQKYQTRFGQLIKGTVYGDYAIENKSLRDNNEFVQPYKPSKSKFIFSIKFKGQEVGIWISYKEGLTYVCDSIEQTSKYRFTITKDDHELNYIMYTNLSEFIMFKQFVNYYKMGLARFKNVQIKQFMFEIMQYMSVR